MKLLTINCLVSIWLFIIPSRLLAQSTDETNELFIQKIDAKIKLDGIIDEEAWLKADMLRDFWQYFPSDTSYAQTKSHVRMAYDDDNLYFAFQCFDLQPGGAYVTPSLRRDFRGLENDVITVVLDPFQDQTNGMLFGVNPYGVQREALISGNSGGSRSGGRNRSISLDFSWDNKWYSAAKTYDDKGYWIVEMAIPFKTLRYNGGSKEWRANFYRLDSKTAERSTWGNIPRNQSIASLAFGGKLVFEEPLKNPGANIAVIPYISGGINKDHEENGDTNNNVNVGGDAKIAISSSLNLDLTINPDFSQVEVDAQQANITRFELFFPERRQFFIENGDLFSSFGSGLARPFFSRRIGIAYDSVAELNVANKILYGTRLSGKLDKNWRIGLMNMQTAKDEEIFQPGYNYSVLAVQRQIMKYSNVSFIALNKQGMHTFTLDSTLDSKIDKNNYNRLLGVDYNLATKDNKWNGKFFLHQSYSPQSDVENQDAYAHGASLTYNTRKWRIAWEHQLIAENYNPEVGFAPRTGYTRYAPSIAYRIYPKGKINAHGPSLDAEYIRTGELGKTDHKVTMAYNVNFMNSALLSVAIQNDYTYLYDDFDPSRTGNGEDLLQGTDYNYSRFLASFSSDRRKKLNFKALSQFGGFYNGNIFRVGGSVDYRFQPFGILTLNFDYSRIRLPAPYSNADVVLVGPRIDVTFTRKIFLTTFVQYNNQIENVNINARLQYRFKPVSDFFLVYTDNYFSDSFKVKNRAIIAKLTYWLNL